MCCGHRILPGCTRGNASDTLRGAAFRSILSTSQSNKPRLATGLQFQLAQCHRGGAVHLRELSFSARQWSPPRSWASKATGEMSVARFLKMVEALGDLKTGPR